MNEHYLINSSHITKYKAETVSKRKIHIMSNLRTFRQLLQNNIHFKTCQKLFKMADRVSF